METALTKNGFVLPIFNDEVVTKLLDVEDQQAETIMPPKVRVQRTKRLQHACARS